MTESDESDLREAANRLDSVREATSDEEAAERLETLTEQVRKMADADRGPDHGRLDRLMHNLREVADDLEGENAEGVNDALSRVRSYRETVEGV